MDVPWSYINKFLDDTEYHIQLMYNDPQFYASKPEDKYPADIWMYGGKMVYSVPGAPYYDGQTKAEKNGLAEDEPVRFRARKSLHDQIQACGLKRGDCVIIEKIAMGEKSFIKIKNKVVEKTRDVSESPNADNWDVAEQPKPECQTKDLRSRSIVFQTCLKCASMVNSGVPAIDVIAYANELYIAHDLFVNGPETADEPLSEPVDKAPKLIEKLYAAFKLPYPDKTPEARAMLSILNGWLLSYNASGDVKQDKFDDLESLESASEGFMLWAIETAEFELGK